MRKITAQIAYWGTRVLVPATGILAVLIIIPYAIGMPDYTFDKKTQRNLYGVSGSEVKCENAFRDDHAIYYHIIDSDYGYQCGYSAGASALTFVFEFVTALICGLYCLLLFVWKDKKCSKMLSYGTLWIPIICQFILLLRHSTEIAEGSAECDLIKVTYQATCSVLPFIFTPLLDAVNVVFAVLGFCSASVMFWCAPKVHKLLAPPENKTEKKTLVDEEKGTKKKGKKGKKQEEEEVFDPIGDMKKEVKKSAFKSFFK